MSRHFSCIFVLLITQFLLVSQVEGQIIRRLRERRAAVQDPSADPLAPAAPLPRLRGLLARRLQAQQDLVAQEDSEPTPASPNQKKPVTPAENLSSRRPASRLKQVTAEQTPAIPRFSLSDLAALDRDGLQSALANVDGALQNDLNRFSSAESWQGFLGLPADVVGEQSVDPEALEASLDRFNRVAANPRFSQISSLSSFVQTRGILAELANRTVGPKLGSPTETTASFETTNPSNSDSDDAVQNAPEQLPAPLEVSAPAHTNKGERSILLRSE